MSANKHSWERRLARIGSTGMCAYVGCGRRGTWLRSDGIHHCDEHHDATSGLSTAYTYTKKPAKKRGAR